MHKQIVRPKSARRIAFVTSALAVTALITAALAAVDPPYGPFGEADQVIWDQKTQLDWQRTPTLSSYTFSGSAGAVDACKKFSVLPDSGSDAASNDAGPSVQWRLPTIKELLSIVDERGEIWRTQRLYVSRNAFAPGMAAISSKVFWSSSEASDSSDAMVVDFETGVSSALLKNNSASVICVRNFK